MKRVIFLLLLALLVFSFGCIGGQGDQQKQLGQGEQVSSSQGEAQKSQQNQDQTQTKKEMKISEVFGVSVPYVCSVKSKDPSLVFEVKVYTKGEKFKSINTFVDQGSKKTIEIIAPGDGYVYSSMPTQFGKCKWIKIEIKGSVSESSSVGEYKQYEDASKWEYHCEVGTFGDDIFVAPKDACTQKEMMEAMMESGKVESGGSVEE